MNSSKTLVNNVAAPRLVTYQIQRSSLSVYVQVYTPFSDNMHHLSVAVDVCDAVWLMFGGRSQSYCEPWDHVPEFKTRSQILIASFLSTCTQHFLLSVSLCGFSACFSPSALHSSSSPVTRTDGSDSGVLPPSPSSSLPTFLSSSLSSPFSSPSLSSSLPICLVDVSVSSVYYHIRKR